MVTDSEVPAEVSIGQARADHEVDEKLRVAAERTRANAAAKAAAGQPSTVREILDARFTEIAKAMKAAEDQPSVRIAADGVPMIERRSNEALRTAMVPRRFARDEFTATLDNFEPRTTGQAAALGATR